MPDTFLEEKKPEATKSLRTHVQNITDKIKNFRGEYGLQRNSW